MRKKIWWMGTLMLSAALTFPAISQQANPQQATQFFSGVNPRTIKTVHVDPAKAMRGSQIGKAMLPPGPQKTMSPFSLGSYFPRVTVASWPPKLPSFATVKTPAPQKFTTAAPGSVNLFKPSK